MFMLMVDALIVVAVMGFIVWCFSGSTFKRFSKFGKSQLNKVGHAVEELDPLSNLQRAVDDGMDQIEQAKKGLEETKVVVMRAKRELAGLENEKVRLTTRIQTAINSGDPNGSAKANALLLASTEDRIANKQNDLARFENMYNSFASQIRSSQASIVEARERSMRMGAELQQSMQERRLSEYAKNMEFDPDGLLTDLSKAESIVQRKIDENRASTEIFNEFAPDTSADDADEKMAREVEAEKILERFKPVANLESK